MSRRKFIKGLAVASGLASVGAYRLDAETRSSSMYTPYANNRQVVFSLSGLDFSSFVRLPCNAVAHDFAYRAETDPGFFSSFSSACFYCDDDPCSGFGATHLLCAMANATRQVRPRTCLISAESLLADFIRSLETNRYRQFQEFYANTDAIFIDDIDFLSGRDCVQSKLGVIVERVLANGGVFVVTFANQPHEMKWCSSVLETWMQGAVRLPLGHPDFDGRKAIVRSKSELWKAEIPDDVISCIASQPFVNVRELEGFLRRVIAKADFFSVPITKELVNYAG